MQRSKIVISALIGALLGAAPVFAQKLGHSSEPIEHGEHAKGQGAAPAADTRFADAQLLEANGAKEAALYTLQQIQRDYPNDTTVLFKLGELAIAAKNWAYAIEVLRRAADLRPDDVQARLVLMDVYRAYQMPIQEIKAGREILALDPSHAVAMARLCSLYEEQSMPDDECAIRRTFARTRPDDYENLKRLAGLCEKRGQVEEALVYYERIVQRFPARTDDRAALARLTGIDGNRYAEFNRWEEVSKVPGYNTRDVKAAYRLAYRRHKRDLRIVDPWDGESIVKRAIGPVEELTCVEQKVGYRKLYVTKKDELGVTGHYRQQRYIPRTSLVAGERPIDSHGLVAMYRYLPDGDRKDLTCKLGYEHVEVHGNTIALAPDAVSEAFPFLERRSYGGTMPVAELDYDRKIDNHWAWRGFGFQLPLEDVDAYVRNVRKTGAGAGLARSWDDGTILQASYQREHFTDGNNRTYGLVQFSYPLLVSYPIHDRQGHRRGFLEPLPRGQLRFDYRFEDFTFDFLSSLYESYPSDSRHTAILTAQQQIKNKLFLFAEGLTEYGRIMQRQRSLRAGFVYEDHETKNKVSLLYQTLYERIKEGTQLNANLTGEARERGVHLTFTWHFDTGPKPTDGPQRLKHK